MKIVIYARPANVFAGMLANSLRQAQHKPVLREKQKWKGEVEDCDLAVIHGIRNKPLIEAYAHVPVFIIESGYLKRINNRSEYQSGHWQLSYAKLNGLPGFDCPPNRFNALGFDIKRPRNRKGYVLVLGQVPTDSALNGTDHVQWLKDKISYYESEGHAVKYRKHPKGGVDLDGHPSLDGTLTEAIAGAAFCVAYNSTAGFEVLLNGVGMVCDECAPYAEISGEQCPSVAVRRAFFNRAAYGQWRVDQTPDAVQFLMNEWLPRL
jgi:hypothetical protein